ncbi:MAG TPA: hypothetical protein DCR68_05095 [Coprothermobacter sp.]|nr:hypothetical protein [Coprothermobacter sp.]
MTCNDDEYAALSSIFEKMKKDVLSTNPKRIGIVGISLLVQKIVPDVNGCTIILNENVLNMSSLDLLSVDHALPTDTYVKLTPKTANKLLRLSGELLTTDVLMTRSVPGNVRKSLARIGFTYTKKSKSHHLVEEMVEAGFSCFRAEDITDLVWNWWEQKRQVCSSPLEESSMLIY